MVHLRLDDEENDTLAQHEKQHNGNERGPGNPVSVSGSRGPHRTGGMWDRTKPTGRWMRRDYPRLRSSVTPATTGVMIPITLRNVDIRFGVRVLSPSDRAGNVLGIGDTRNVALWTKAPVHRGRSIAIDVHHCTTARTARVGRGWTDKVHRETYYWFR